MTMTQTLSSQVRSFVWAALAAGALLGGCASSSTRIEGRVIGGPVGVATLVSFDDERLSDDGVAGVEVALLRDTGPRGGGVIAKGTTDETGVFEIVLARGQHPGGAVIVRVTGDTVFDARARSFLPTQNQRLLCTVIQREAPSDP